MLCRSHRDPPGMVPSQSQLHPTGHHPHRPVPQFPSLCKALGCPDESLRKTCSHGGKLGCPVPPWHPKMGPEMGPAPSQHPEGRCHPQSLQSPDLQAVSPPPSPSAGAHPLSTISSTTRNVPSMLSSSQRFSTSFLRASGWEMSLHPLPVVARGPVQGAGTRTPAIPKRHRLCPTQGVRGQGFHAGTCKLLPCALPQFPHPRHMGLGVGWSRGLTAGGGRGRRGGRRARPTASAAGELGCQRGHGGPQDCLFPPPSPNLPRSPGSPPPRRRRDRRCSCRRR